MGVGHVGGPAGQRCSVEQQSDQRASLFPPSRDVRDVTDDVNINLPPLCRSEIFIFKKLTFVSETVE